MACGALLHEAEKGGKGPDRHAGMPLRFSLLKTCSDP